MVNVPFWFWQLGTFSFYYIMFVLKGWSYHQIRLLVLGWGWGSPWPPAYSPRLGSVGQGGRCSWVSAALASAHPASSCLFFFWLHQEACGILVPWPGVEPGPSAVEGAVLTSGLPGNSPQGTFLLAKLICSVSAKYAAAIPVFQCFTFCSQVLDSSPCVS